MGNLSSKNNNPANTFCLSGFFAFWPTFINIKHIKSCLACWYAFFDFFDSDLDKYDVRLKDWNTKPEDHWKHWGGEDENGTQNTK